MEKGILFIGTAQAGHFIPDNKRWLAKYLSANEGKRLGVYIERYSGNRSNKQNAYLHALISQIAEFMGELGSDPIETVKRHVKEELGYSYVNEKGVRVHAQTSKMSKMEFAEFVDKLRVWALTFLGLNLPTAEEFKALHRDKYPEDYE